MKDFIGILLIIVLIMLVIIIAFNSHVNKLQDKIDVCEKELPRNEHCVLVAVPKEGK